MRRLAAPMARWDFRAPPDMLPSRATLTNSASVTRANRAGFMAASRGGRAAFLQQAADGRGDQQDEHHAQYVEGRDDRRAEHQDLGGDSHFGDAAGAGAEHQRGERNVREEGEQIAEAE